MKKPTDKDKPKKKGKGNNPNIANCGRKFGEPGALTPKQASDKAQEMGGPYSVRNSLRRIAAHDFEADFSKPADMVKEIEKKVFKEKKGAAFIAYCKFRQALTNPKSMDSLIDAIDGKQIETKVEAKVSYEDIVKGSYRLDDNGVIVTGEDDNDGYEGN